MKKYLHEYCVGYGLCSAMGQAELQTDHKGYLRPIEGNEQWLESVCPAGGTQLSEMNLDKIWGKCVSVYYGWSEDEVVRKAASSGGVLTEIAAYLLENQKVDAVLHVCADAVDPTKTEICVSCTREELASRCGSRYAISHPLSEMGVLDKSKKYAFIGKPCDVTALKNYIRFQPEMKKVIAYTLSFFCAGLPSKDAQKNLLKRLGCEREVEQLRYRGNGWPGYTTAIDAYGKEYRMDYGTAWGRVLGRDIMKACRVCLDGIGEMADVSCGDAWYLTKDNRPDFSERDGRNVVFARTETGRGILEAAMAGGYLHLEPFQTYEESLKAVQTYQYERKTTMAAKLTAMRLLFRSTPKIPGNSLKKLSIQVSRDIRFSVFKGTVKRILQGKI